MLVALLSIAAAAAFAAPAAAAGWGPPLPLGDGVIIGAGDDGSLLVADARPRAIVVRRVDASGRQLGRSATLTLPRGAHVVRSQFAQVPAGGVGGGVFGRGGTLAVPLCLRFASLEGGQRGCARSRVAVATWDRPGARVPLRWVGPADDDAGADLRVAVGPAGDPSMVWVPWISGRLWETVVVRPGARQPKRDVHRYRSPRQEMAPAIAVTAAGQTLAVWPQGDGIHASWDGRERRIAAYATGGNSLSVAAGADGTALGSFVDARGRLRLASARPGERPRLVVVASRINEYGVPAALAAREGRVAVAWVDLADRVRVRTGPVGGPLGPARRLGRIDAYGWPQVALDARGRAVVAAAAFRRVWAQRLGRSRRTLAREDGCELWRPFEVSPSARRLTLAIECRRVLARAVTVG